MSRARARAALSLVVLVVVACESEPQAPAAEAAPSAQDAGPVAFDHGKYALKVKFLREQLADKQKCHKKTALELSKFLNEAGDYDGNVAFVDAFAKECGEWPRHWWSAAYSREQQKRWDEAAAIDSKLIAHDGQDSDFWWWRGRAHGELGRVERADADFRQSMANKPTGWPAFRHPKYVGDKLPCASAFMIQWWIEHGSKVEDWAAETRSQHYLKGGCAKLEGKGKTSIKVKPNAPTIPVSATVNGKKGSFLLAERSAFTTLSAAFADKAGVTGDADIDPVLVFGELLPAKVGTAAKVAVGAATAPDVRVAITDKLPGDVDGVIGLSFLWRFHVDKQAKAVTLKPR